MNAVEAFNEYATKCGVVEKADGLTTINQTPLNELGNDGENKGSIGYLINLDYPHKIFNREAKMASCDTWRVLPTEGGVFITDHDIILMFMPIYELHACHRHGHLVAVTGHEETAVISLDHLEDSFVNYTR